MTCDEFGTNSDNEVVYLNGRHLSPVPGSTCFHGLTTACNMSLLSDMKSEADDLVWKALSDPIRRRVLDLLAEAPRTTGELVDRFDALCRTAVMKHLDVLVRAELISVQRQGRTRWNYLNPTPLERVLGRWLNQHMRQISASICRLKEVVEANASDKRNELLARENQSKDELRKWKVSK
jgi:DNA-binding transcriptional ArsR family regulator